MDKPLAFSNYPVCDHIKRKKPYTDIDKEIIATFRSQSNVIPLFENKIFEYTRMRHYYLMNNELLRCRWREYTEGFGSRVKTPFVFPEVDDFHFYNYHNRYEPTQSIINFPHYRKHLRPGPGVDFYGHIPIPDDMHSRKTVQKEITPVKRTYRFKK